MPSREVGEGHQQQGDRSTDLLLGELIAEVRAVKHEQRQSVMKLDAVNSIAGTIKEALRRLEKVEREQELHHSRLAVLEADKHRREGAVGLVEWFARHWPVTFVLGILAAFIAWANGVKVGP